MLGYGVRAELGHLAQHRPAAPGARALVPPAAGDPGQRLQPRPHRIGVGVVGVIDHGYPVGPIRHLHPVPRHRPGAGQCRRHLVDTGSAFQRDRAGAQRVGDLMVAVDRELDLRLWLADSFRVHREPRPGQFVQRHRSGPDVRGGALAATDPDHPRRGYLGHGRHHRIVGVEYDHPRLRDGLWQFGFCPRDGLT